MNKGTRQWFGRVFWIIIGLLLLYISSRLLIMEYNLRNCVKIFNQVEHPQGTTLIRSVKMKFSYYPATYVDDSISFQPAYLVGEMRSYTGGWDKIAQFYHKKKSGSLPIQALDVALPLESPAHYDLGPFYTDLIRNLDSQYLRSMSKELKELEAAEQSLYLVFVELVPHNGELPRCP